MNVIKIDFKDLPGESALSFCRKLIKEGVDPNSRLEVYRGDRLDLIFHNILEASQLTVEETKNGPKFKGFKGMSEKAKDVLRKHA